VWQLFLDVANAKFGANFRGPWMVTDQNDFDTQMQKPPTTDSVALMRRPRASAWKTS